MAKSQTNYATNASNDLINQARGLTTPLFNQFQNSLGTATQRQGQAWDASFGALNQDLQTGGYDPSVLSGLRDTAQGFVNTGGFDPTKLADAYSGYDKAQAGYEDLATTGGYTPEQGQAFIRQATEGTESTYGSLADQAKRASIATGGQGTTGAISQMARQLSQAQGKNTLDAEVALNERQTANKLSGLGGETNVAGGKAALTSAVASGKRAAETIQQNLEGSVAGGKLQASQMMNQLFNTTTGQVSDLGTKLLQTLGLDFSTQQGAINSLVQLSKNPGKFQTAFGDVLAAAGAAAGLAGGFGLGGGGDAALAPGDSTGGWI